jgi:hypoxanthine phosphoribosyltransferase
MLRQLRYLTWNDFDKAVNSISNYFNGTPKYIYGQPRGGLCLAVAISHKMKLPLVSQFTHDALWIDDVVETGKTFLEAYDSNYNMYFASWFAKEDKMIYAPEQLNDNEWLVFPWEDKANAERDMKEYELSRQ